MNNADSGCFAGDGRFFFAGDREIWEGGFLPEPDPGADGRIATLVGARIAPVSILNTDYSNAGSMDVEHLTVAGKWLYAGLRGHHMGCILRLPVPAKILYNESTPEAPEPKAQLKAMRDLLGKTEIIIPDTGVLSAFCACEVEGRARVFYRGFSGGKGKGLWIWDGAGEPKRLADDQVGE